MKNIIILLTLLITANSYSQVDFVKYFNGEKVEIENVDNENGKLFIDDKEVNPKDIELLFFNGKLKANVFKIDAKQIAYLDNYDFDYLFADRIIKGKINLFSYNTISGSNKLISEKLFYNIGIDGKVSKIKLKDLKPMLSTNRESFKYFKKANSADKSGPILFYISMGLTTTGLGMFFFDMLSGYRFTNVATAGVITASAGGTLFFINLFIPHSKSFKKNIKKSVEAYNYNI